MRGLGRRSFLWKCRKLAPGRSFGKLVSERKTAISFHVCAGRTSLASTGGTGMIPVRTVGAKKDRREQLKAGIGLISSVVQRGEEAES